MIHDGRKLEFSGKFDAIWMGLYMVKEAFPNNSLQLETLNGENLHLENIWKQVQTVQG